MLSIAIFRQNDYQFLS